MHNDHDQNRSGAKSFIKGSRFRGEHVNVQCQRSPEDNKF
jgi:hypothetical protein